RAGRFPAVKRNEFGWQLRLAPGSREYFTSWMNQALGCISVTTLDSWGRFAVFATLVIQSSYWITLKNRYAQRITLLSSLPVEGHVAEKSSRKENSKRFCARRIH